MKKIYLILLLAIGTIVSCGEGNEDPQSEPDSIEATFSDATITRVVDEQWLPYDKIGIFMIDQQGESAEYSNICYQTASVGDKATFVAANQKIYFSQEQEGVVSEKVGFRAYSPYVSSLSNNIYNISVATNQDKPELIDLLYAETGADYSEDNPDVNLDFKHILTKLTLTLEAKGNVTQEDLNNAVISISGVAHNATFNLKDQTLEVGSPSSESIIAREAVKGVTHEAILIPDEGINLSAIISINGIDYPWALNDSKLTSGEERGYTLTISDEGVTVSSATISNWAISDSSNEELLAFKTYDIILDGATYNIYTAKGLRVFANLVNGIDDDCEGVFKGETFANFGEFNTSLNGRLMDDIDLEGSYTDQWSSIGTDSYAYAGTFDGNNKTISGLYINTKNIIYIGLFGVTDNGSVLKNITIDGSITSNDSYVGGVVGFARDGTEIKGCTNMATISGLAYIGGIVGYCQTSISDCYNKGVVIGYEYTGGVVGNAYKYGYSFTIDNCHNHGSVIGKNNIIGGVVGYTLPTITVTHCSNSGSVVMEENEVDNDDIGGVVGNSAGHIYYCYNTGEVKGCNNVGGVAGESIGSISNCYNAGIVTATNSKVGGVVGDVWSHLYRCYNLGSVKGVSGVGGIAGSCSYDILYCYNLGNINGHDFVAGIVGHDPYYSSSDLICNNYNAGAISGVDNVSGILGGYNRGEATYTNSYYIDKEMGLTYISGEAASESLMKTEAFVDMLNEGCDTPEWQIDDPQNPINNGYPILIWQLENM